MELGKEIEISSVPKRRIINRGSLERVAFLMSTLMFRGLLDYLYIHFVIPFYGNNYMGFGLEVEGVRYTVSWVMTIFGVVLLRERVHKFSDFILLMYYLSVLVPIFSIWGLNAELGALPVVCVLGSFLIAKFVSEFAGLKSLRFPFFKNSQYVVVGLSFLMVIYLLLLYTVTGAILNINFDMSKVYEFREQNSKMTDFGVLAYLNVWVYKVFNLLLMAIFLWRKKYLYFFLVVGAQIVFFGVSAHKAVFFFPFVVVFCYIYFKNSSSLVILPVAFLCIACVAYFSSVLLENNLIASILVRRLFYVPASTTFTYFEFADAFGHVYWANSIFSFTGAYEYSRPITHVIGDYILGSANADRHLAANNGFVSSGYLHAGILGVVLYSFVLGYLLKIYNSLSRNGVPIWIPISITVIPYRDLLISSDLFTSLLTHGLLVATMLLILMRRRGGRE